jgi:hypothetical protein
MTRFISGQSRAGMPIRALFYRLMPKTQNLNSSHQVLAGLQFSIKFSGSNGSKNNKTNGSGHFIESI